MPKLDNLDEMDEFLGRHKVPKLIKEADNLNRSISGKKIKLVVWKLPEKKNPSPVGFTGGFYQAFKEQIILILHKLFQKIEEVGTLTNSDASIALIPKPDKDTQGKKIKEQYPLRI